jgi:hypothetical protein
VTSVLSLAVERLRVIVRIDGVDVSRADDNDGPDPWYSLVPVNRFVATDEPTTVIIAGCRSCGPACDAVEVRIRREGETVRWEWGGRTALFDAAAYDAEVARIEADRGWETPAHRAGRIVFAGVALPPGVEGVRVTVLDTGELEVWLEEPDTYQIWLNSPWDPQRPDHSAAMAREMLARPAADWPARWHGVRWDCEGPPAYAGPSWQRAEF